MSLMRLLQLKPNGEIVCREPTSGEVPAYAILSHTWGEEEVVYRDLKKGKDKSKTVNKAGWRKIQFCAKQAAVDGLEYFWIDTCCIDKKNAVELGAAINSMFRWYQNAARCYVYLSDVSKPETGVDDQRAWGEAFRKSRWFTRGWTLQELIAPRLLDFFSSEGKRLGSKLSLESEINEITGIEIKALRGDALSSFSIKERRSWVEHRNTTIEEDEAYCLIGIFDVSMVPNYGERRDQAFRRLEDEIHRMYKGNLNILNWLTKIDYGPQQSDFLQRWETGTCQWLLDSKTFLTWVEIKERRLFCPGIPGAGKTILTSIVVDQLMTRFEKDKTIGIAYIYCNFQRQDEQKAGDLLGSLLKQLAQDQSSSLPESVKALYDKHKDKRTRPSFDEIRRSLHSVAAQYSRVFIFIDALDECRVAGGCRDKFLSELFNLQAKCGANVFATSRFIPDIMAKFNECESLEIRASDHDIRLYIGGRISLLPSFVRQSLNLQEEIKTGIVNAVNGMFLLAQLHLDSLIGKRSPKSVGTALGKLPTGSEAYDHAYRNAMIRIEGQVVDQTELAKQVLSWITCAKRPMTTSEVQHALAVEANRQELDEDNLVQIEDIVSVCAGLVTVDKKIGTIRLVHYTTQEYFERTQKHWFPNAETDITEICITYLSFKIFESGICKAQSEFEERLQSYPLYDYAAHNWGHHAREATASQMVSSFLQSKTKVEASSQALMSIRGWPHSSQHFPMHITGLHLAAYFGVEYSVRFLTSSNGPDLKDSYGRTPLSYAAGNGHVPAVQLLLEKRADIDFKDNDRRTPLWYAAEKGHVAVVQLLLDKGAEIQPGSVGGWLPQSYLDTSSDVLQLVLARDNSKKETGMVGLLNQGATGYLNVVLQSFYHIKTFREAVHRIPTEGYAKNSVIWALQRLFHSLQASIIPVSTQELTNAFGWNQRHLYERHDAFEMWELLLERIEQKMRGFPNQNAVSDFFSGKVITSISCTHVDDKTSQLEDFHSVSLHVDGNRSLDDSFREYTKLDILDGECQYYAGDRYGLQDAVKGVIFQNFPPVLVLQLRWWKYNIERDRMESIFQDYEFPEEFNATPYLVSPVPNATP
ncbi:MAG: hypothetical protein Q9198_001245 [Flavoplaca austrocitrina]